jgi:hypothetical protein
MHQNKTVGMAIGFRIYIKQELLRDRFDQDLSVKSILHYNDLAVYHFNPEEVDVYLEQVYGLRKKVQLYYTIVDDAKFSFFILKHPELISQIYDSQSISN